MTYAECTINQYKKAMYSEDYSEISKEDIEAINTEYVNTAGLFESEEFEKISYIHYLNCRVNTIKLSIDLQKRFIDDFGEPYKDGLELFLSFGYSLSWDNDIPKFIKALNRIEVKEAKYISQLESKVKDFTDSKKNKKTEEKESISQRKGKFIRLVNSLGKMGWKIDNDKTTMEEFSYMVKQQLEENK